MNEQHFAEIEKVLVYVSEARKRAEKVAAELGRDGAEPHLVGAVRRTDVELLAVHRRLMQGTYFAVPDNQLELG